MKVNYWSRALGKSSTAYLDDEPGDDGAHLGIDKHTDEYVVLRWNDELEQWDEV